MGHKTDLLIDARMMRASGWSIPRIASTLGISKTTVYCWVNPEYAERRRRKVAEGQRRRRAGHANPPYFGRTDEAKLKRIRDLAAAGVPPVHIGRVVGVDFGEETWTRSRVVTALREDRIPRRYRKRAPA